MKLAEHVQAADSRQVSELLGRVTHMAEGEVPKKGERDNLRDDCVLGEVRDVDAEDLDRRGDERD
jgi:hypothetical protein